MTHVLLEKQVRAKWTGEAVVRSLTSCPPSDGSSTWLVSGSDPVSIECGLWELDEDSGQFPPEGCWGRGAAERRFNEVIRETRLQQRNVRMKKQGRP